MNKPKYTEYELKKDNYGLKAGERFIYLACLNLFLRKVQIDSQVGGELGKWEFTPDQMASRYFKTIK